MSTRPTTAVALGEQIRLAHQLADVRAVADIEFHAVLHPEGGTLWWDTRPMLDPREMPPECIDMANAALTYARLRGLIYTHPQHQHLVRITPKR